MQNTETVTIADEINRLRTRLADQLAEAQARLKQADENLASAQTELNEARTWSTKAASEFDSFNKTFPAPAAIQKANKKAGTKIAASPQTNGGRVVVNKPTPKKRGASLTVPERVAAAMGNTVSSAPDVLEALERAGESFESSNPRSYISTTLNSSMTNVEGPDGDLRDRTGKRVKVHMFTAVERGKYRVSTTEDIQREIRKILGADEVVISEESGTPADKLFDEQGINVRGALPAHH